MKTERTGPANGLDVEGRRKGGVGNEAEIPGLSRWM